MAADQYILVESTLVFYFPVHEDLKKLWIKFMKKNDWNHVSSLVIYIKQFEQNYIKTGKESNTCNRHVLNSSTAAYIHNLFCKFSKDSADILAGPKKFGEKGKGFNSSPRNHNP